MEFILDSRESNPIFLKVAADLKYRRERLVLSKYIILPPGVPDLDAGDFTNSDFDGIVEFKTFGDFINSTTGDGVHHLHEQAAKLYSTGLPFAIIVYGSRWLFKKESGVGDGLILQGLQKLTSIASNYKATVVFCENEEEALLIATTFIRKCRELPRRMPVYNLLKGKADAPVAMLCGVPGVGQTTALKILEAWTFREFLERLFETHDLTSDLAATGESLAAATPGVGKAVMQRIASAILCTGSKDRGITSAGQATSLR